MTLTPRAHLAESGRAPPLSLRLLAAARDNPLVFDIAASRLAAEPLPGRYDGHTAHQATRREPFLCMRETVLRASVNNPLDGLGAPAGKAA